MTGLRPGSTARERRIVRLAAEQVRDPSTRSWLFADERGTWERSAAEYLEKTATKARDLGLSAAKVDEEIAAILALSALQSQLEHRQRRSADPVKPRAVTRRPRPR